MRTNPATCKITSENILYAIYLNVIYYFKYLLDEVEEVLYIDNGSEEIQNKQTSPAKNPELLEDKSPSVSSEDEKPFSDSPIDPRFITQVVFCLSINTFDF